MLKKSLNRAVVGLFFLSLILFSACKSASNPTFSTTLHNNEVVDAKQPSDLSIQKMILPYKNHVDAEMNKVLSYSPKTMDKYQGEWETTIGNLLATSAIEMVEPVFFQRTQQHIDACMFNHGGIRAVISQGKVFTRTAYEVMPFENEAVVLTLTAQEIRLLADYFVENKKAHPMVNIKIFINDNHDVVNILMNDKPLENDKNYYILTSDYLANGGDGMSFFTQAKERLDMNYKLRNVLIDYFTQQDTLPVIKTQNVIKAL